MCPRVRRGLSEWVSASTLSSGDKMEILIFPLRRLTVKIILFRRQMAKLILGS